MLLALVIATGAVAQRDNDQRTLTTKIADVLAELPAEDTEHFEATMKNIGQMGEEGLLALTAMLVAPENGDNTQLEYALAGFSFYVTQPDKEELRKMSVNAYCQALSQLDNADNKAFIIRQLEMVGADDAVTCLAAYLTDPVFCAPAAKALTNINTAAANQALLEALKASEAECRVSLVKALGDNQAKAALDAVTALANSEEENLRKVALYALANIADEDSEDLLQDAAEKDKYGYDEDNATSALLLYLQRLVEAGEKDQAEDLAEDLLKNAKKANALYTRTAALELLTSVEGEEGVEELLDAMKDDNKEYRAAALKFAAEYINPATTKDWLKKARRSNPEVEAEIITMLGENNARSAIPQLIKKLDSRDRQVKMAAITALGKIGDASVVPHLIEVIKKGDSQEIAAVKEAFYILDANEAIPGAVAEVLAGTNNEARAALLSVLGRRAASENIDVVLKYAQDEDQDLRTAALTALTSMATKEDLPELFSLLNEANTSEEIALLQQAVVVGIGEYENQSEQTALLLEEMQNTSETNKPRYFTVLASIGGEEALEAVSEGFEAGNSDTKVAAINALSGWSDPGAADKLFELSQAEANKEYKDQALAGYIKMIGGADFPAVQKLLLLRKAFEGSGLENKRQILKQVAQLNSFHALTFAGEFLDNPQLQQDAAMAVINIALDSEYKGEVVRNLLEETVRILNVQDSQYIKQSINKFLDEMPKENGFVPLFNGEDLTGWKGLVDNPIARARMSENTLKKKQKAADEEMRQSWKVQNGELVFTGKGNNIATDKHYGDFELLLDWKIYDDGHKEGDAGIYLRGTPQVQMWDTARVKVGAQVGSGGLYNNQIHESDPLVVADNPLGEWNHFRILMKGDKVTVYLNGVLVTDNVVLENYWDRKQPIFPEEQIELQAHGSRVAYRDIYIREIPRAEPFELTAEEKKEGFEVLFDGTNMDKWTGNKTDYVIENGEMVVREPKFGSGGNLYSKEEYEDFVLRFEFKLTPGANNGLGIRSPLEGDAAYSGLELQILDNTADIYKDLEDYQYHGSAYGLIPAKRGFLKPVGEWNYQEVIVDGSKVKVILNGTTILEGDLEEAGKNPLDGVEHPGLDRKKGHIGFLGHGSEVWFRNIRIKELE